MSAADPRRYVRYELPFAVEVSAGGQLQACEGADLGAGGCQLTVLFPLQRGQDVRVRLRSERARLEPNGPSTVAWASRSPPYRVGLQFSGPLAEQVVRFLQEALGPVRLTKGGA